MKTPILSLLCLSTALFSGEAHAQPQAIPIFEADGKSDSAQYQNYREPVVGKTTSGRLVAGKGRGKKYTAPIYQEMHKDGKPFLNAYMVYSDDEGKTWSKPRDITSMTGGSAHFGASEGHQLTVGKNKGRLILARWQGSGHGCQRKRSE
jgi:hypothetical protein